MAQGGLRVFEYNRIHRERVESGERRKPEHERLLTARPGGGRSYPGPEVPQCYNREFRFLATGTCYQVCIAAREC